MSWRAEVALLLCLAATGAAAAPVEQRLSLPGMALGEQIVLRLRLPEGQRPDAPARQLWVLDGENAFDAAAEAIRLVALECDAPEPVLVAVSDGHAIGAPGNQRGRDYTPVPSTQPWARGEGGGAAFLVAMRERMLPAVDAVVGPARERMLYGHSYGGLFVAQAWLQAPQVFDRWALASPALYYGGDWAQAQARCTVPPERPTGGRMLLLAGSEEAWAVEGNKAWRTTLQAWPAAQRPLLESALLPGLGHLTGSATSLMRAVRWAYCAKL